MRDRGSTPSDTYWAQRRAMLRCALALGEELGEAGVTMRTIAKRMGINQATIYLYFEDKSALMRELEREAKDRLDAWLADAVAPHVEPRARLLHLSIAEAEFARVHPWLYKIAFESARMAVQTDEHWQEHPFVLRVAVLLADVADRGVPDVVLLARQLCVAVHGLATTAIDSDPEPTFVERYVEAIVDGVCAPVFGRPAPPRLRSRTLQR
jgi:AcrR family transcriptional regulator